MEIAHGRSGPMFAGLVFLISCGGRVVEPTAANDPPRGTPGDPLPCSPLLTGLALTGEPIPGQTVTLLTHDGGTGRAVAVTWSVPSGFLSSNPGAAAQWTIRTDLARDVPETLTVSAAASSAGCPDEHHTLDVVVDWPERLRTLVLYNSNPAATGSRDVADHYAAFRGVPPEYECGIDTASTNNVPDAAAYASFWSAVSACVGAVGPHVHYLVPVYGVPITASGKINDTFCVGGRTVTVSLDSLLSLGSTSVSLKYPAYNALFINGDSMHGVYPAFTPFGLKRKQLGKDLYLVGRIDGVDAAAAKALVDRTARAENVARSGGLSGTVYVDGNRGLAHPADATPFGYNWGEWNIIGVEKIFTAYGKHPVVADYNASEFGTAPAPLTCPDALYYAGWYSLNHYNDVFTWAPGAIGGHLDSASAYNIRGTTSWSAVALQRGITATFGAIDEPCVSGLPKYDQLFKLLLDGASYGEAGYASVAYTAWMNQFIGDPLYRPYASELRTPHAPVTPQPRPTTGYLLLWPASGTSPEAAGGEAP